MSITLDDTWGGGSANVYITLADADALLTFQVLDAQPWTDAEVTPRNAALLTATRQIDSYNWAGGRYFYRQALLFPRVPSGNIWPYGPYYGAAEASPSFSDFIEQDEYLKRQKTRVKRACALQALWLLRQPSGRNLEREAQVQRRCHAFDRGPGPQPKGGSARVTHDPGRIDAGLDVPPAQPETREGL